MGLSGVPDAGDEMIGVTDERDAKLIAQLRGQKQRENTLASSVRVTLEDLHARVAAGEGKELVVVIKADGHGSI